MAREDYRHLPEPVRSEETLAEQDARAVPDPEGGLNRTAADALEAGG